MKRPRLFCFSVCVFGALLLLAPPAPAQNPPSSPAAPAPRTEAPFLIPQTIFVGDPGRLVIPLGQAFAGLEPFMLETPDKLPETPELLIQKIELERRGSGARLLIDFIPYAPGTISFPSLEFLFSGTNHLESKLPALTGLKVQVASILNPSQMALSEPASALAVPGTSFLVYGTLILVILLLSLGIGGSLWGRRHFRELWERLRRRHLLRVMIRFLQRLRRESLSEKSKDPGFYLTLLSGELREFLSFFTGVNCRSLAAGEFLELSLGYDGQQFPDSEPAGVQQGGDASFLKPDFLCRLFRNWDTLRFSGRIIDRVDLFLALKQTEDFVSALDRAEREQPFPKLIRGSSSVPAVSAGGADL